MAEGNGSAKVVPEIRKLLKSISEEITDEELSKLLFLARDNLPKGQTQNINCLKLFGILEERSLIETKTNDVEYLLDLLRHIPRLDLCRKLKFGFQQNQTESDAVKMVNGETKCPERVDGVTNRLDMEWSVSATSVSYVSNSRSHVQKKERFLQDPDLFNSMYSDYHEMVRKLEEVTEEKVAAASAMQTSEEYKMALQTKINNLEFELDEVKNEHNNLICERNNALAAKSESAFKETTTTEELRQTKKTMRLLEDSLIKSNNEVKEKEEENTELKSQVEKYQEEIKGLKSQLEQECFEKKSFKGKLEAMKGKLEEGNGRIKCKRCGLIYVEANNPFDACRSHPGQYSPTGSLRKKYEWSCCKNTNKNAPGCTKKKHLSIDVKVSPGSDTATRSFSFSGNGTCT